MYEEEKVKSKTPNRLTQVPNVHYLFIYFMRKHSHHSFENSPKDVIYAVNYHNYVMSTSKQITRQLIAN